MTESHSLTLERGVRVLRTLAEHPEGLTVSELAAALETHRPGIYRLLGPLGAEHLVSRDADGRWSLGLGLVELASGVRSRLPEVATPVLQRLADELEATTALTLRDGDEAVVASVVEPRNADAHLSYRAGIRHSLDVAAPGLALLAAHPRRARERAEVTRTRKRGWARSSGELVPGATGIAAAIGHDAAVSAVWLAPRDEEQAAAYVVAAARDIAEVLR